MGVPEKIRLVPPKTRLIGSAIALCLLPFSLLANATYQVLAPDTVSAGKEGEIHILFSVDSPWYIYAPTGVNVLDGMVETSVTFAPTDEIQVANAIFPDAVRKGKYEVFEGEAIKIVQPIRVRPKVQHGTYRIRGVIEYQVCKFDVCLPPARDNVQALIVVN